jgi:membrane-bound lytic murein transglycosylase F
MELAQSESVAWAFAPGDGSLGPLVRRYFAEIERDGTLAGILDRYYSAAERFDYLDSINFIARVQRHLPRLRPFFEEAAAESGFDWRLLAAVGYQESKFDPLATSPTGVRGVMMLTEDTARRVGVTDRLDARSSILGGARYLREVRGKIPGRVREPDRTWLALAAYNIGFGHLEDARIITESMDADKDSWEAVREHLPLLADEDWYPHLKRGYAQGTVPVQYVDNVRYYYRMLEQATSTDIFATVSRRAVARPSRDPI